MRQFPRRPDARPFVDAPVTDPAAAERVARVAAERWELGPPRLLRLGMNAVFAADSQVLRVGSPTAPVAASLDLAARLAAAGVRVPQPARDDAIAVGGFAVTAWERIVPTGEPIDWVGVGEMVARLHVAGPGIVPADYPCPSPVTFPWWDFDPMLTSVRGLVDEEALATMEEVVERNRWWREATERDAVVCHGDVHPGNVLQTESGPVLLDWDLLCRAPHGWDHGPLMTWAERWGGRPGEYEDYATGYGWSGRGDPFAEAVAELRLVAATLMRVRAGRSDPVARAEAESRLEHWRGRGPGPAWRAQ